MPQFPHPKESSLPQKEEHCRAGKPDLAFTEEVLCDNELPGCRTGDECCTRSVVPLPKARGKTIEQRPSATQTSYEDAPVLVMN